MAASSNDKSHKCCAAATSNNRSDNQNDLIFHNFLLHESQRKIWEARMKRADEKFASNTSLFCCSKHFTEKDYRKSMTGQRHDLVKDAVPSVFPWSLSVDRDKERESSERAKVCEGKRLLQSVAGPLAEIKYTRKSVNDAENSHPGKESEDKPQEKDLGAEISDLRQKLFLSSFGLEQFKSNHDDIFLHRI